LKTPPHPLEAGIQRLEKKKGTFFKLALNQFYVRWLALDSF
jgi:hypothetical protein